MRTRVKICGITRREDALTAIATGADAIGFVFYPPSPRAVTPAQAAEIVAQLPPFITVVGLFVDEDAATVAEIMAQVGLDRLQFHGDESPAYCRQFNRPYFKVFRMRPDIDLAKEAAEYADASAILLDSYQPNIPGGTGEIFDWQRIAALPQPLILAGGLNAQNVANAINTVQPYAVDVSGGVERSKGIKDAAKIAAFMQEVTNG